MKRIIKRIAAMSAAVMMMSTMAMGASATYGASVTDRYQSMYFSGGETTTNNYVAYTQSKNLTSAKRYMVVRAQLFNTSKTKIAGNNSSGPTAAGVYRQCIATNSTTKIGYAYHVAAFRNGTSSSADLLSKFIRYVYY